MQKKDKVYYENLAKISESHTVEQLEEIIIAHWYGAKQEIDDDLEDFLSIRKCKINKVFEWTPENREKLLALNQKLINCFEKLRDEALPIIKTLQKRVDEKDAFLHEFYLKAKVTPYIFIPDENGILVEPEFGIETILTDSLNEYVVLCDSCIENEDDVNEMSYLGDLNWNIEPHFEGKFNNHLISQGIHDLYDHTKWSFPDILKINHLETELEIVHRHLENISPSAVIWHTAPLPLQKNISKLCL